ncbi:MAG: STAS/SEC14 domain-containing protein [Caldilineaceae bacterium]
MYKKLNASHGNVFGYEITGRVTEEEYQALRVELHQAIVEYGGIRLLISMPELPATEWGVVDEDLRFALEHMDDIERCAIVGDSSLVEWITKVSGALISPQVKHFEPAAIDAAWRWI